MAPFPQEAGWCGFPELGRRVADALAGGALLGLCDLHSYGACLLPSPAPGTEHYQGQSLERLQALGGVLDAHFHCLVLLQAPGVKRGHGADRKPSPVCMVTHLAMPALCSSCSFQHLGTAACKLLGGCSPQSAEP